MRAAFDNLPLTRRERLAFGLMFVAAIGLCAAGVALLAHRLNLIGAL